MLTKEHRENIGKGLKGRIPWNKGKSGSDSKETLEKRRLSLTGKKRSEKTKERMRQSFKGRVISSEQRKKISKAQLGKKRKPLSLETKKKISITLKIRNNPNFSEDTIEYKIDTESPEYFHFKKCVLERDKHACQTCGSTKNLEVHHAKPKALFPELLCSVENGITLCDICHCAVDEFRRRFGPRKK